MMKHVWIVLLCALGVLPTNASNFTYSCHSMQQHICVVYSYSNGSEYNASRNKCQAGGNLIVEGNSCPKGRGAYVCAHQTASAISYTYSYPIAVDPQSEEEKFRANCVGGGGHYLGSGH